MGRYTAECPECHKFISFRDEHTQWAKWLDEEYDRGYKDGLETKKSIEKMEEEVAAMQGLLAANARVLREEIKKSIRKEDIPTAEESEGSI